MQAVVGDHIVVESATLGRTARLGEVLGVLGQNGEPPYRVRWADGAESLYSPGADARVRLVAPEPDPEEAVIGEGDVEWVEPVRDDVSPVSDPRP